MAIGTSYLGKGVALPFRADPATGDIAGVSGRDNVKTCVRMFFMTSLNELDLAEGFGIRRVLFENLDVGVMDTQASGIKLGLARYEPRIQVLSVEPRRIVRDRMVGMAVRTVYRIRATGEIDELEYVFDRNEE